MVLFMAVTLSGRQDLNKASQKTDNDGYLLNAIMHYAIITITADIAVKYKNIKYNRC